MMRNLSLQKQFLADPSPNTFAGLMEMYEANYIRLRKLCGTKNAMPAIAVSRIPRGMDLYLQVLEQTRYTSTIVLTYYFTDAKSGVLAYPNLKLRIYYDALQAEVLSQTFRNKNINNRAYRPRTGPSLPKRWHLNRFLFKWLSYCDRQGHSFVKNDQLRQNRLITEDIVTP